MMTRDLFVVTNLFCLVFAGLEAISLEHRYFILDKQVLAVTELDVIVKHFVRQLKTHFFRYFRALGTNDTYLLTVLTYL